MPILAGNSAGYTLDRLLQPCMKEYFFLVEEGVTFERIDSVLFSRLGASFQPLRILSDHHYKNDFKRLKKESKKEFNKYIKDKEDEEKNPSTAFKPQPSSLPDRQNPDEEVEVVIRPPVVLSDWNSALASSFMGSREVIAVQPEGGPFALSPKGQKMFDDFQANRVS